MSTAQTEGQVGPPQAPTELPAPAEPLPPGAIGYSDLVDERGPIPEFGPAKFNPDGTVIHPLPGEMEARYDAYRRARKIFDQLPNTEPPGLDEEIMRGIDAERPPGQKLFEGYY